MKSRRAASVLPSVVEQIVDRHLNDEDDHHGDENVAQTSNVRNLKKIRQNRIARDEHARLVQLTLRRSEIVPKGKNVLLSSKFSRRTSTFRRSAVAVRRCSERRKIVRSRRFRFDVNR